MDLTKQIPTKALNNLCIGCVPKDSEGREPYGHTWEFGVCGKCGEFRIVLDRRKLKPVVDQVVDANELILT